MMAENKTKPTELEVGAYLDAITDESRRADCRILVELIAGALHEEARMWGRSIVGFGSYHYVYESGREGDSCLVGFSSRKTDISLYLAADYPGRQELLDKLGSHKTGKGCLYLRQLSGIDRDVLREIVIRAARQRKENHQ
jgi:hypothetical protein